MVRYLSIDDIGDNVIEDVLYYDEDNDIFFYVDNVQYSPRDANYQRQLEYYNVIQYNDDMTNPYIIKEQYDKYRYPLNSTILELLFTVRTKLCNVPLDVLNRLEQYTGYRYIEAQDIISSFEVSIEDNKRFYDIVSSSYYFNIVVDTVTSRVLNVSVRLK